MIFNVVIVNSLFLVALNLYMGFVIVQWSLSKVDAIGTQLAVLYREVSLVQR